MGKDYGVRMNYFAPKSFIRWCIPKNSHTRLGVFIIDPVNDQYNHELYWCWSYLSESQSKFRTSANNREFKITSPWCDSEEEAIRWLERKLKRLALTKIGQANQQLKKSMLANYRWMRKLNVDLD